MKNVKLDPDTQNRLMELFETYLKEIVMLKPAPLEVPKTVTLKMPVKASLVSALLKLNYKVRLI